MSPAQLQYLRFIHGELYHALALINRVHVVLNGIDEVVTAAKLPIESPITGEHRVNVLELYRPIEEQAERLKAQFNRELAALDRRAA